MRIILQPAYILHARPYRETSLILELFTEDHGRISLIARGIRQRKTPLKSLLQPFTPLMVSWQGKTELMNLSQAEPNGPCLHLQGDCLLSGFYLNELLLRLLQKQDPHPNLYTVYQKTLLELQRQDFFQKALRLFEKNLLNELGYGVQFRVEGGNEMPLTESGYYRYYPEHGFVLWEAVEATAAQAFLFSGKSLLAFANETLNDAPSLQDAKRLMRQIIQPLLGGKPLLSRKLFVGLSK